MEGGFIAMSQFFYVFQNASVPRLKKPTPQLKAVQAVVLQGLNSDQQHMLKLIFSDQIRGSFLAPDSKVFVRAYLKGVSHPMAESLAQVLKVNAGQIRVDQLLFDSAWTSNFKFDEILRELEISWREPAIEELRFESFHDWEKNGSIVQSPSKFEDNSFAIVNPHEIGLEFSQDELLAMKKEETLRGRPFNRAELELIAQTWSEHCKHKIFAANIHSRDTLNPLTKSLFKQHIRAGTLRHMETHPDSQLLSVFHDNAGVLALYDWSGNKTDTAVALKMETHNSPSAIAPYGGASTGIVGVHRDILGTGLGAKPIANWDVLCFESPTHNSGRPETALSPDLVRQGVLKGIEDGGNQSGIPTVQGSVVFDPRFAVKPYVFAGCLGILPERFVKKRPKVGLKLFCIGGAVGRDGLRGAVMSSRDLRSSDFSGSAVQVANAFVQRRVTDFLIEARDRELIDVISDNGAGGLGSSCGEMATATNGAEIDLTHLRLKTTHLFAWERLLSESQERMTIGTSKPKVFMELLKHWELPFDELGVLNSSGNLKVSFQGKNFIDLRLEFLHEGCPQLELNTSWSLADEEKTLNEICKTQSSNFIRHIDLDTRVRNCFNSVIYSFKLMLGSEHLCSRKAIVERFDHEVQGRTLKKPFQGLTESSPADCSVLEIFESKTPSSFVLSHALCPWRERMEDQVLFAFDEAMRSLVLGGAQSQSWGALDNFSWPNPIPSENLKHGDRNLWRLVRSCEVLSQLCLNFSMPLISGKDSMKNNSRDFECPATLVISMGASSIDPALLPVSFFVRANDVIFYCPPLKSSLKDSSWVRVLGVVPESYDSIVKNYSAQSMVAEIDELSGVLKSRYQRIHSLISKGLIRSAKDVGEGGLLTALFEMCLGREMGFQAEDIDVKVSSLFEEGLGSFVFSLDPHCVEEVENALPELKRIGVVSKNPSLKWGQANEGFEFSIEELKEAYEEKSKGGFFS